MRSFPNHILLFAAVVERISGQVAQLSFDRLYGNFEIVIDADAHNAVHRSADRHIRWVRGDYDQLT